MPFETTPEGYTKYTPNYKSVGGRDFYDPNVGFMSYSDLTNQPYYTANPAFPYSSQGGAQPNYADIIDQLSKASAPAKTPVSTPSSYFTPYGPTNPNPNAKPMPLLPGVTPPMGTTNTWQMPALPTYTPSTYTAPTRDMARESELVQKNAAAPVGKLSNAWMTALTKTQSEPNPYIRKEMLRQGLSGYGEGLNAIMSGAGKEGRAEYAQEYAPLVEQAKMNFQAQQQAGLAGYSADITRQNMMYEAALKEYLASVSNPYGIRR